MSDEPLFCSRCGYRFGPITNYDGCPECFAPDEDESIRDLLDRVAAILGAQVAEPDEAQG